MSTMYDCDVCLSAGSVNQWGFCEICGEDFEDPQSLVGWRSSSAQAAVETAVVTRLAEPAGAGLHPFSQDAA